MDRDAARNVRRRGGRATALAGSLGAALLVLLTGLSASASAAERVGQLTPVVVSPVPQKQVVPVRGSDGRWHVMYELELTNTLAGRADLRSVAALDARTRKPLLRLGAKRLIKGEYLHTLNRTSATTTRFAGNQARVLILNLSFKAKRQVPRALLHRFAVKGKEPFSQRPMTFRYTAGEIGISRKRAPVLQPPLEGDGWLASNAPTGPTSHVNAIVGLDGKLQPAERYAIDWIQIDPSGRIFTGDKTDPRNWYGYGARVKAVGDGVVTAARDGLPDQTPGTMPSTLSFAELPGNYVSIRMRGGRTAGYAHLVPGSVSVNVGDRVRAGQTIGLLGNSGASLAPHLHFHVVDGPDIAASDGSPYVIGSFDHAAQSTIDSLLAALQGEAGFPTRAAMRPVARHRELPLDFTINDFPAGP